MRILLVVLLPFLLLGACTTTPSSVGKEVREVETAAPSEVPPVFTVRTDTLDGIRTIIHASGDFTMEVPPEYHARGTLACQEFALSHDLDPRDFTFSGWGALDPRDRAVRFICIRKSPWPRDLLEEVGKGMDPPRTVLSYRPETREVQYGPVGSKSL